MTHPCTATFLLLLLVGRALGGSAASPSLDDAALTQTFAIPRIRTPGSTADGQTTEHPKLAREEAPALTSHGRFMEETAERFAWQTWDILQHLIAGLSFATIVKVMCMAGNILVQVSPYPQVRRWATCGSTGEADAAPYVSIAFGGWQWCYYGVFAWWVTHRSGFLVLVHSNMLGAILGTYYTYIFYKHCCNEETRAAVKTYLSAVAAIVLFQVCALMVLPPERALFTAGLVASFCSFVGAISMLVVIPTVVRTRDSAVISGPLVMAYFASALVWCLCGWMLADPLIAAPNIVAAASSAVCIYFKHAFGGFSGRKDADACLDKVEIQCTVEKDVYNEYNTFCDKIINKDFSDDTGGTS